MKSQNVPNNVGKGEEKATKEEKGQNGVRLMEGNKKIYNSRSLGYYAILIGKSFPTF
jgi:hypothetical protein